MKRTISILLALTLLATLLTALLPTGACAGGVFWTSVKVNGKSVIIYYAVANGKTYGPFDTFDEAFHYMTAVELQENKDKPTPSANPSTGKTAPGIAQSESQSIKNNSCQSKGR